MSTDTLPGRAYAPNIDERAGPGRRGALPERVTYRDTGCDMASSCLSCPFPICREDMSQGIKALKLLNRRARVLKLTQDGLSRQEIADEIGVTVRQVSRIREAA